VTTRFESPSDSPGFLLWHATLRWQRLMTDVLRSAGLTHVQFVLLASLWWLTEHGEPPSQRELAHQAGTDPMMTSQVVRALEQSGYLHRAADAADARVKRLHLTPAGQAVLRTALPAVEAADQRFFSAIGDHAQIEEFSQALRRLADLFAG
jgi:DNA-binding MarR family transcriptional regulator